MMRHNDTTNRSVNDLDQEEDHWTKKTTSKEKDRVVRDPVFLFKGMRSKTEFLDPFPPLFR